MNKLQLTLKPSTPTPLHSTPSFQITPPSSPPPHSPQIAHLSAVSTHCRDTAIEIFNRFLAITLVEDAKLLHDTLYLSLAAAASLILSSKVHEGKANLTIAHFPHFSTEDLVAFERMMLIKIECKISALSTPTAFIAKLLELWPDGGAHHVLAAKADLFIAEFYEASESMFYAPSSLAISALLLSFSVLRMDCSHWLACIPDACFPRADNLQLEPALLLSLDIDACLTHFQSTNSVRSHLSPINLPTSSPFFAGHSVSPTSVADLDGGSAVMYHPSSPSYYDDMRSDEGWRSIVPFQTAGRGGAASRVRALSCASPPPSPRRRCRSRGSDGSGRYDAGSIDVGAIEADSEL